LSRASARCPTPRLEAFAFPTQAARLYRASAKDALPTERPRERQVAVAGILDPRWRHSWRCVHQLRPPDRPPRGGEILHNLSRLVRADTNPVAWPANVSCRTSRWWSRPSPPSAKPPSSPNPVKTGQTREPKRLPPTGPGPCLRLRTRPIPGRHWYPGFATEGPASDMLSHASAC